MAKMTQIALAAILLLLFTLAESTTVTTTTTTTIIEKKGRSQCDQEIMPKQMLSRCMMYVSPMKSMNVQQEHLQECCEEFKQIDMMCRCKAMKEMVMDRQEMGQMGSRKMKQMVEDVMNIPSKCNVRMPEDGCDIGTSSYDA